jgi:flavin-dependent trigonelline monooxygenase, reductase component
MARVGREGVQAALQGLIAGVGVQAEGGSIYAVYEDAGRGTQHIALRCRAVGEPAKGAFVDLSRDGVADVTDPALRAMLERLAEESRMGNYGVYFGSHAAGRVS